MELVVLFTFVVLARLIIRSRVAYERLLGAVFLLAAVPVGVYVEISVSGCCGGTEPAFRGAGIVIGVVFMLVSAALFYDASRVSRRLQGTSRPEAGDDPRK